MRKWKSGNEGENEGEKVMNWDRWLNKEWIWILPGISFGQSSIQDTEIKI